MKINLSKVNNHPYLKSFNDSFSLPTAIARNVLDLDKVCKTVTSIFKVFELPDMPKLPPFFERLNADLKVSLDQIAAIKFIFRLPRLTSCDAVGRTYFETQSWTVIVDDLCMLASNLLGTVKYIARLAAVIFPAYLSLARAGFTCACYLFRTYNDYHRVIELNEEIKELQKRREAVEKKVIKDFSWYESEKSKLLNKIEDWSYEANLLNDWETGPLDDRRKEISKLLEKIQKAKVKINRYTQYLDLCAKKKSRLLDLKRVKWENRITLAIDRRIEKVYSRNFHGSLAGILAVGIATTAFAIQSLILLEALTYLGVAISLYGMAWMVECSVKRKFEII